MISRAEVQAALNAPVTQELESWDDEAWALVQEYGEEVLAGLPEVHRCVAVKREVLSAFLVGAAIGDAIVRARS